MTLNPPPPGIFIFTGCSTGSLPETVPFYGHPHTPMGGHKAHKCHISTPGGGFSAHNALNAHLPQRNLSVYGA